MHRGATALYKVSSQGSEDRKTSRQMTPPPIPALISIFSQLGEEKIQKRMGLLRSRMVVRGIFLVGLGI